MGEGGGEPALLEQKVGNSFPIRGLPKEFTKNSPNNNDYWCGF
jgi:hypothetical protein